MEKYIKKIVHYIYLDFWPLEAPNFGTPEVDAVNKSCTEGVTTDLWGLPMGMCTSMIFLYLQNI